MRRFLREYLSVALVIFGCLSFQVSNAQCNVPTGIVVNSVFSTSVQVSWSASASAPSSYGYFYEVRTAGLPGSDVNSANGYVASGSVSSAVFTTLVEGLRLNTLHYFYIRYRCQDASYSDWSTPVSFTTLNVQPPVANSAIYVSDENFTARWSPSVGATGYRLDVSQDSDFSTFVVGFDNFFTSTTSFLVDGLDPSTAYYYRVRAEADGGALISLNSNVISVVTLSAPVDYVVWTETGWSVDPTLEMDAIIAYDYNTGIDGVFEAKNLIVNEGVSFIVASETYVMLDGVIQNNAGVANFVVENNANLIQLNEGQNEGEITVIRDGSPLFRLDYSLWSSPAVSANNTEVQKLNEFSPLTNATRFYNYNSAGDVYASIASNSAFEMGKGYLIRVPNTHVGYVDENSVPQIWTGSFLGTPNNGTIPVELSNAGTGYNLIGNPYPSVISVEAFFATNEDNVEGTLYFWRRRNGAAQEDYTSYYATYTEFGGTASATSEEPNGFIQVGQGFLVQSKQGASEAVFTNEQRVPDNFENQFFRMQQTAGVEKHRVWLNLTANSNFVNQILVGFMDGATEAADDRLDGKYINDSKTALTSLINNEEYSIQAKGLPFDDTKSIKLGFKAIQSGNFTIDLHKFDGVFAEGEKIYLKDNLINVIHDLKGNSYSFTSAAGVFNDRFEIVFRSTALSIDNPVFDEKTVITYVNNQQLHIQSMNNTIQSVQVFDVRGRKIADSKNIIATETAIDLSSVSSQVLLMKIETTDGEVVKRKFIK